MSARESFVYFARAGSAVKIGYALDVASRIRAIQTGCPIKVELFRTIRGGGVEKRWLHEHFAAQRLQGEWFRYSRDMLTIEVALASDSDVPAVRPRPIPRRREHFVEVSSTLIISTLTKQVRAIVGASPGTQVRGRIFAAAQILRLPQGRIKAWYYGEVRRVEVHEADQIRFVAESIKNLDTVSEAQRQLLSS